MSTICDVRARVLRHLALIVETYGDDQAAGGLHAARTMLAAGLHWPDLLPPLSWGYQITDKPMLDLVGFAVRFIRHIPPFKLAVLAVIAAKRSSIECRGMYLAPFESMSDDRKAVLKIIEEAEDLAREDRLLNQPLPPV